MTQYLSAYGPGDSLRLDGVSLPGIITALEVDSTLELEKKRLEGTSYRKKIARGYKDATVKVELEILPPDEYRQLALIQKLFAVNYAAKKPKPYRIVSPSLDARGVYTVLFTQLKSREGSEDDTLFCSLEFLEFEPAAVNIGGVTYLPVDGAQPSYTPVPSSRPAAAGEREQAAGAGSAPTAAVRPEDRGLSAGTEAATGVSNILQRFVDGLSLPFEPNKPSSGGSSGGR